jgi:hypothetical protein
MKKNKIFLSMNFSYPFLIKFYYFYSAIVALKFKLSRKRSRIINPFIYLSIFMKEKEEKKRFNLKIGMGNFGFKISEQKSRMKL